MRSARFLTVLAFTMMLSFAVSAGETLGKKAQNVIMTDVLKLRDTTTSACDGKTSDIMPVDAELSRCENAANTSRTSIIGYDRQMGEDKIFRWNFVVSPAFERFLRHDLSVGAAFDIGLRGHEWKVDGEIHKNKALIFGIDARVGYMHQFGKILGIWPHLSGRYQQVGRKYAMNGRASVPLTINLWEHYFISVGVEGEYWRLGKKSLLVVTSSTSLGGFFNFS